MTKGQALLIGVNEVDPAGYGGTWDGKLRFCERDARGVAEVAEGAGYDVRLLLTAEATKSAVVQALRDAAAVLETGDSFLLFYSGHGNTTRDSSGDEADQGNMRDETLCLYDTQILDDELYALWQRFKHGVRVVVLTDACHSGSILMGGDPDLTPKSMDATASKVLKRRNPRLYADMRAQLPPPEPVQAGVLQLAGCREDQLSYESRKKQHGQFTAALLKAWGGEEAGRRFSGSYRALFDAMHALMPAKQKPVMAHLGVDSEKLEGLEAFGLHQ